MTRYEKQQLALRVKLQQRRLAALVRERKRVDRATDRALQSVRQAVAWGAEVSDQIAQAEDTIHRLKTELS